MATTTVATRTSAQGLVIDHLDVSTSGTYRISAHRGPASDDAYPGLLVIPSHVQYKCWFISFEEGDSFDPDLDLYSKLAKQVEKVTVRHRYLHPGEFSDSIREALLAVGECVSLDDNVKVCNEALYGSEEADVRVTFPRRRARRQAVRSLTPRPWASVDSSASSNHPRAVIGGGCREGRRESSTTNRLHATQ